MGVKQIIKLECDCCNNKDEGDYSTLHTKEWKCVDIDVGDGSCTCSYLICSWNCVKKFLDTIKSFKKGIVGNSIYQIRIKKY